MKKLMFVWLLPDSAPLWLQMWLVGEMRRICANAGVTRRLQMQLLQKIEFWLFSVPALIVAIGGIAHYGAWRVLWVFPIC